MVKVKIIVILVTLLFILSGCGMNCSNIKDDDIRKSCNKMAEHCKGSDVENCEEDLENMLLLDKAISELSMAPCKVMTKGSEDTCYYRLASLKKDVTICNKVEYYNKRACYYEAGMAQQDLDVCGTIEGENKDHCLNGVAVGMGDVEICDQIVIDHLKTRCYWGVGIKLKDVTICDQIDSEPSKQSCYDKIAESGV